MILRKRALSTLTDSKRSNGLSRIIASTDNNTEQLVALEGVLHDYAVQGGPEIDSGKLDQFINTDRRFGNSGERKRMWRESALNDYATKAIRRGSTLIDTTRVSLDQKTR